MPEKKQRSWGIWVAAAVVALAVIVGVAGLIASRMQPQASPSPHASSTSTTRPSATSSAPPQADGPCSAPSGDMTAPPSDLKWISASGVSWVTSKSLGPTSTKDGFPVCFSHSPVGAALAATNMEFLPVAQSPYSVTNFYVLDGPGKAAALQQSKSLSSAQELQELQGRGISLAGFRIDQYTGNTAYVEVVLAVPNSSTGYRGAPIPLVWTDGDWRAQVQSDGTLGSGIDVNPGQFTKWGN